MAKSKTPSSKTKVAATALKKEDVAVASKPKSSEALVKQQKLLQDKLAEVERLNKEIESIKKEVNSLEKNNTESKKDVKTPVTNVSVSTNEDDDDDSSSDDSSSDDDDDEDDKKVTEKAKATTTKESKKKDDDDDSDDDDSDDSDDDDEDKMETEKVVTAASSKKEDDDDDDDDDSDDDSSDDSDDDDDEKVAAKKPVEKKAAVASKKEEDDDDDDDSDDDSDDSDDDEEEEKVVVKESSEGKKRKQAATEETSGDSSSNKKFIVEDTEEGGENSNTSIYVRGLPWRASEDEIRDFFSACGTITSLEQPLMEDGRSSGTAVVNFDTTTAAEAAIALNGQELSGRWLSIQYNTPKSTKAMPQNATRFEPSAKDPGCVTVFVGNLSWNVDEDAIRAAFGECGEISSVRFATDKETGDFKGFGHVEFTETEATDKAVEMAGTDICGRPVRVDYANDKRNSMGGGGASPGGRGGGRGGRGYMGGGGGGGDRGGRGGGRGGRGGGRGDSKPNMARTKNAGSITAFAGNKITFD